jgi:protein-S-isoprenylcysteine O-methyltransferase Ste14
MKIDKLFFFPPPMVALLLIGAARILDPMLSWISLIPASSGGIVWIAAGLALSLSAAVQFHQIKTTVLPMGTPTQLVTLGAYLWTRNPMYLGILTALLGLAIIMGTLPYWLVPPAFFLIINRIHIPYEEAQLEASFGPRYVRYRKAVSRWL